MTDSAVTTESFTVTPPAGTPIASCGLLPAKSGTFYLTGNLSCPGNGIILNANNQNVDLNGYTLTYGTGQTNQASGSDLVVTNGSTVVTSAKGNFTSAMVGWRFFGDNYNSGGFENFADTTTVVSVQSPTQIALSTAAGFSTSSSAPGEYFIPQSPTYGVVCDQSPKIGGGPCVGSKIYNGTITQSTNASPNSNAIQFQVPFGWASVGNNTVSDVTINISQPETEAIDDNNPPSNDVNTFAYNTVNDSVTTIYYRDGLPYPIKLDGHGHIVQTAVQQVHDNVILGSPQGGIYAGLTTNAVNNYDNHNGAIQYANGFGLFSATSYNVFAGNTILGTAQGIESEATNLNANTNYIDIVMSPHVHDPNHNPSGCEIGYSFRSKDFGTSATMFDNLIDANWINSSAGTCGEVFIEFSILWTGDTATVSNNLLTMALPTNPSATSAILGVQGGNATWPSTDADAGGITYANNTLSRTGAYASSGYDAAILYNGITNWDISGLNNPQIVFEQGDNNYVASPSTFTFSGAGTATVICQPASGGSALKGTYNGTAVSYKCP